MRCAAPRPVETVRHVVIHRDPFAYCAHPHLARLTDGTWLLVFNRSVRRRFILHPPQDPHFYNVTMRSEDEGRTWTIPEVAPGYDWHGVECAGLTTLGSGSVLLHQWRFRWHPLAAARQRADARDLIFPENLSFSCHSRMCQNTGESSPFDRSTEARGGPPPLPLPRRRAAGSRSQRRWSSPVAGYLFCSARTTPGSCTK